MKIQIDFNWRSMDEQEAELHQTLRELADDLFPDLLTQAVRDYARTEIGKLAPLGGWIGLANMAKYNASVEQVQIGGMTLLAKKGGRDADNRRD